MKGVTGLLIAASLAIIGAFCNWFYLAQKSRDLDLVEFIGIAADVQINPGDKFKETDLVSVPIPQLAVGNLEQSAPLFRDRNTVIGMSATRSYVPGEIVLRQDLRTPPPPELKKLITENERVMWIPIDTRTFVPGLANPGDLVSFVVPKLIRSGPQPVQGGETAMLAAGPTEILGPFRILALGTRLGSADVMKAAGQSATQENVIAIPVKVLRGGELEENAQKLADVLRVAPQLQVVLNPSPDTKK